jgi:hypothetical protein
MLVELIMVALVIIYIGLVALGHALLVAAIYRCLREDHVGGRRRTIGAGGATMADHEKAPLPAQ